MLWFVTSETLWVEINFEPDTIIKWKKKKKSADAFHSIKIRKYAHISKLLVTYHILVIYDTLAHYSAQKKNI